jgi:hypothetical protein
MKAGDRRGICAYCGREKQLTDDHVPPKSLLKKPYPPNLWTVPACRDCHVALQKDDDYTRTVNTLDVRSANNPDAQSNLPAILRSLERADAKAFAEYLSSQTVRGPELGEDGLPIHTMVVDRARLDATGKRLLRGLFFLETGIPMPPEGKIRIASQPGADAGHPLVIKFAEVHGTLIDRRHRSIGTAFSYVAGFGNGFSVWLLLLYDHFAWVGTVDCRRESRSADE